MNHSSRFSSAAMYFAMSSLSVTYLSVRINDSARIVSSESLFKRRGTFFGFVLPDKSLKNLPTILRISSAEIFTPDGLFSFFSLEFSLEFSMPSWRKVLPPRPPRPP